jgi:hypothetical protein
MKIAPGAGKSLICVKARRLAGNLQACVLCYIRATCPDPEPLSCAPSPHPTFFVLAKVCVHTRAHTMPKGSRHFLKPSGAKGAKIPHRNAWSVEGLIQVAFRGIGMSVGAEDASGGVEVGAASGGRNLEATSLTAAIWRAGQSIAIAECLVDLTMQHIGSLFLGSYYDSTPTLVSFGSLQDALMPHARLARRLNHTA